MTGSATTRALLMTALLWLPALGTAEASGLLGMLTGQLGVTEQQASGGMGALMGVASQNLGQSDYTRLLTGAPDLGGLGGGTAGGLGAAGLGGAPAGLGAAGLGAGALGAGALGAPQTGGGLGSMVGGAGGLLGGQGGSLGQAASLAQSFQGLGLSPDMVGKFAKVALDYVQQTGGSDLMQLLRGALPL